MTDALSYAKDKMAQSPLKELAPILDSVNWQNSQIQKVPSDVELSRDGKMITVYPSFAARPAPSGAHALLTEVGGMVASKWVSQNLATRWKHKLVLPTNEQIGAIQDRITAGNQYAQVVESFAGPVDRLVAIHVVNALIANKVRVAECRNIDVRKWGSTADFCGLKRYYSLTPLISAYCSRGLYENYGSAFANVALGLELATHSAVSSAFKKLVVELAQAAR